VDNQSKLGPQLPGHATKQHVNENLRNKKLSWPYVYMRTCQDQVPRNLLVWQGKQKLKPCLELAQLNTTWVQERVRVGALRYVQSQPALREPIFQTLALLVVVVAAVWKLPVTVAWAGWGIW
jgi:hypothetical protein